MNRKTKLVLVVAATISIRLFTTENEKLFIEKDMSRLRFVAEQNLRLRLVLCDHGECVLANEGAQRMEEWWEVADVDLVQRVIDSLDHPQDRDEALLELKLAISPRITSVNQVS